MTIRPYQEQDKSRIVQLFQDFQTYLANLDPMGLIQVDPRYGSLKVQELITQLNEENIFLVAQEDSIVIGCVLVSIYTTNDIEKIEWSVEKYGEIKELFVDVEYRAKGVGKKLVEAAEQYVKEKGCGAMFIEVFLPNTSAKQFYEKLGYEDRSVEMMKLL